MDKGKVIDGLQKVSHYFKSMLKCGYDGDANIYTEHRETVKMAIELLKEQEAVEPIITPWAEDEDGNIVVAKRECGKCGYQFFTERPNFCENCGTPILWEGR